MKKTTLLGGTVSLPQNLLKRLLLSCFAMVVMFSSYAATISSKAVTGNWSAGASWVGNVAPAAGDNVIIVSGANITVDIAVTRTSGTTTVNSGGILTLGSTLTSNGSSITINGALVCGTNIINGSSSFTLASALTASMQTANVDGITSSGTAAGSIQNTSGTRSFGSIASYTYNGTANQVTGNGLPLVIQNLTINNTGGVNNNIVTLTNNNTVITGGNSAPAGTGGVLTLTAGILNIGTGKVLQFANNSGTNGLNNSGGNLATTGTNGSDGGTVFVQEGSGSNFNINGSNTTTFYNLRFGNAPGNGNRHVVQTVPGNVLINDSLIIYTQQFQWLTNAPIYGSNSTLYINTNGNQFNLVTTPSTTQQEWLQLSSGTIGVTAGYPNNVTLSHIGSSQSGHIMGNGYSWVPTANWSMNGVFTLGDAIGNAQIDFSGVPLFTCGGIVINSASRFTAPQATMIVNGSWIDNQPVVGTTQGFFIDGTSTINFGGSGTCGTANIIQAPGAGTETFYNVGIINSTYTKLNSPVTITHNLALTSGILATSNPTNILSVTNNATTAITGGGAGTYIDGPVKWSLQAAAGVYNFPVGSNGVGCANDYLPFSLNKFASSISVATVQAITPGSGGTVDATLGALSSTEYWSLATTVALASGSKVSVARPTPITPLAYIAQSTTGATGTYTSLAGTAVANGVNNSNTISTNTALFYTLGAPPIVSTLAATSITTTSVTLNGAFNTGSSKTTSFNYGTSAPTYGTTVNTLLSPINSTTATLDSQYVTGLIANTEYHYLATDGTDNGSDVTFITAPNPPVVGTPNTPTVSGFTATWSAPAAMGSAPYTYTIQVSTDPTFATGVITQTGIASGTPTSSYVFTTLASATQYYYRVEAVNATASSAWSATSTPISTLIFPTPACTSGNGSPGTTGTITSATSAPSIDGVADAVWSTVPSNNITQKINITPDAVGAPLQAVPNNTATWKTIWDGTNLYIFVQVQDAYLVSHGAFTGADQNYVTPPDAWAVDGIELYLSGINNKTTSYNNTNDFQLRFNLGEPLVISGSNGNSPFTLLAPRINFKMLAVPGGYNLEAAIPWSGPGGINSGAYPTIAAGNTIGIDFSINDNDGTTYRSAQQGWYDGLGGYTDQYTNPSRFGTATLATCPVPPTVVSPTVTNITATGATLGATVTSSGDAALTVRGTGFTQSPDNSANANALPEGGTGVSVYSGPARTGLLPQTQYYYLGYATNANAETGISDTLSFYTLSALPATQPTLSACGANNNLTLSWSAVTFPPTSAATNTGYLILRRQDGTDPTTAGINTRVPATQGALPAGTTLLTTITDGSTLTYVDASAVAGTTYNYLLVPYTYDGTPIDSTYNYSTTAAPTTSASLGSGGATPVVTIGSINPTVNLGTPISLVGNSTITGTPTWSVTPTAPIVDPASLSTTSTPTAINTYTYTLSVNAAGCVGTAQKVVSVVNAGCDIVIPNAFTPNNDGYNDTWIITGNCYTVITVDVYNRWGSRVYHSDNYSSGSSWDGKYQGKDVADATYYYVVTAHSPTANPILKGSVTVVR